ncbi:MAG: hypothetical protein M5U12_06545 [Verrucomicrobia bacterium]|nr:hypothetical protein [Verrucomicrobiota bacterium]
MRGLMGASRSGSRTRTPGGAGWRSSGLAGAREGATALLKRYFGAAVVPKRLSRTATKQERNPSARSIALPWTY